MPRLTLMLAAVFLLAMLSGCGQSGPLYLPGNPSEIQASPPEPEDRDDDEDEGDTDETG